MLKIFMEDLIQDLIITQDQVMWQQIEGKIIMKLDLEYFIFIYC